MFINGMRANISKFNTVNFKGYDACPLKSLYMQGLYDNDRKQVYHELKDVSKKEGFDLFYDNGLLNISSDNNPTGIKFATRWAQDPRAIILRHGQKTLVSKQHPGASNYALIRHLKSDYLETPSYTTGGNIFIGKKSNGTKWALIGRESLKKEINNLREFCDAYDIKPKNVHIISQPNFHIDMAIRPIGYPYILVNDENIVKEQTVGNSELQSETDNFYNILKAEHSFSAHPYANCDTTVKELQEAGFIPIRIGGVYTDQINYMNAIINKHPDGTISYITNSEKGSKFEGLDEVFERELKAKVPNIRDIYFISGGETEGKIYPNTMMEHLGKLHGGIHCLTLEEPNFERWG